MDYPNKYSRLRFHEIKKNIIRTLNWSGEDIIQEEYEKKKFLLKSLN